MAKRLALEGSGNLRAAFLKNHGTKHNEQPQSGKEGKGAQNCGHHGLPPLRRLNVHFLFSLVKHGFRGNPSA